MAFWIALARCKIVREGGLYFVICGYALYIRRVSIRLLGPIKSLVALNNICNAMLQLRLGISIVM